MHLLLSDLVDLTVPTCSDSRGSTHLILFYCNLELFDYSILLPYFPSPISVCISLLLSPACGQRPLSGDYKMPSVPECVRPSICQVFASHSFIKIFSPNLQGMFMAIKPVSAKF